MPPKRACGRETGDGDALAECVLPEEMMLCILTRLPVKSIHRFKSVCKPWRHAFSTPKFRKMHHAQFSENPENESIFICNPKVRFEYTTSLLKIKSSEMKKPINLCLPFPIDSRGAQFVGCCNGLLCLAPRPSLEQIYLWNPALNSMYVSISTPEPEVGAPRRPTVSLGFGYNEEADDFKLVRIVALGKEEKRRIGVEVYSVNANSWTTIDVGFQYSTLGVSTQTIVNGNLYWSARDYHNRVMLCFDVGKSACKIVHIMPIPCCLKGEQVHVQLVDWKGAVAALVCKKNVERVLSIDVWIFDDSRETWSKNFTFGPIELKVVSFSGFWKNRVLLEEERGKLFAFDTENGGVEKIVGAQKGSFCIYGYTESLMFMEGMRNQTQ